MINVLEYLTSEFYQENDKEVLIKKSVPGYGKEDLDINVINKVLFIKSKDSKLSSKVLLSDNVDLQKISAKCDKGVLTIIVPKKEPNQLTVNIE